MSNIRAVCVYCGSSSNVDEAYKQAATQTGALLAAEGWTIVYGGASVGLMGLVADSALEAGTEVTGVMPRHILDVREVQHKALTQLHVVESMHARKQMMVDLSDAFVILPGGLGTLDEFFELLTWKQIGLHDKPVVIVNLNGYWTKLLETVRHIADTGFMRPDDQEMFIVIDDVRDIPDALKTAPREKFDPTTKWI